METPRMSLSVKVIVRDPHGCVLLLRRSLASKGNPGKWEFPGGKVDAGEAFDAALVREVREETGLTIQLAGSFGTCESKLGDRCLVYLVLEGTTQKTDVQLSTEHDAHKWVRPDDFGDVEFAPQFRRIAQRYIQDVTANPRPIVAKAEAVVARQKDIFEGSVVKPASLETDLQTFIDQEELLKKFSVFLKDLLATKVRAFVPAAEVNARAKDPVSYAGKLIKKDKYINPWKQVTDLVGARVVVHLGSEVEAVCRWIETVFEVDQANSGDKLKDLGADKFGYRSVHYVVEMRDEKPSGVPPEFLNLKAEIQVRTIAQHAWSDIGHDRVYKADCDIPDYWKREANRISALLEAADEAFARLVKGIDAYHDHSRQSPTDEAARRQLALWDVVRRKLPKHPSPASRAARLAFELQDWSKTIQIADEFEDTLTAELLGAKGYALCKKAQHPFTAEWTQGVEALEQAAEKGVEKVEPLLRLGELFASHKREQALSYYESAFARDSSNPAALVGYVRCKVLEEKRTAFIPLLRPDIERAIKRSEELAAAGADLPHSLYRIAEFLLLLGPERANESLAMLARAVHGTNASAPDPLLQALKDISELASFEPSRPDIECARRFLGAAFLARCPGSKWPAEVTRPAMSPLKTKGNVVIVAGGCDPYHDAAMRGYGDLLTEAFAGFEGTIISGGTTQGISGVVGELSAKSHGRIRAVGYLPKSLPTDGTATKDERYERLGELRRTDGGDAFTAREPIQSWLDLLAADIRPQDVRLLGLNGGNIAGLEYRIAVALGACVGVIEGSGREAERVAGDWLATPRVGSPGKLFVLPPDAMTLRAFIEVGVVDTASLPTSAVEQAARLVHQIFLEEQRYKDPNPVMQPWSKLRDDLRESNRNQIVYLVSILRAAGFGVRPVQNAVPNDPKFTNDEIKYMGEMEHGRWNVERLASGWKYAKEKDANKKLSPYLVPWEKLEPGIQKYDVQNVRAWPQVLAEFGYEIWRYRGEQQNSVDLGIKPATPE
jgi:mutator protein MutT